MLTIEEKIRQLEAIAESGDELYADYEEHGLQDTHGARRAKSLIEEKRQEIAWLRELVERRKAPEIVRCRECKRYNPMSSDWGNCYVHGSPTELHRTCYSCDYCSWAERRTDD